jgi:riboflavin kinase/FMN adenylyltransferase
MNVFQNIENYNPKSKCILTIGTFDGVHIGHQEIIKSLVELAQKKNLQTTILTFFPHPRMVLQKESDIKLIDTLEEKKSILEKLGVDNLIIHPFSKIFSRLSAVEFCRDVLANQLQIDSLFIGYDHRFGRNREATAEDLISLGKIYNFDVVIIPAQDIESITVSSTKARKAIAAGAFELVHVFLGRYFELTGTVTRGQGLGRTINFPTANISIAESYKLIPPIGVYLVTVQNENLSFNGMMNIGNRPTLDGEHQTLEVHLFDCSKDLYGQKLKIFFLEKIREEQKFESLDALKIQLLKDKEICKRTLIKKGLH